jgi:formylglycine-generating enzyme required for sulfatase activity
MAVKRVLLFALLFAPAPVLAEPVPLPSGCFQMGCSGPACKYKGALPARKVCLDAFALDSKEVTVAEYATCVAAGKCQAIDRRRGPTTCNSAVPGRDRHPVTCVTWDEAQAYCSWAGMRLPTEAEWEYAARGTRSRTYPWGDGAPTCDRATIDQCKHDSTQPVGSHPTGDTDTGLSDLAGNAYEWVADWYAPSRAPSGQPANNPRGPCAGQSPCDRRTLRVMKGGAYSSARQLLPAWARYHAEPTQALPFLGFRCAR